MTVMPSERGLGSEEEEEEEEGEEGVGLPDTVLT